MWDRCVSLNLMPKLLSFIEQGGVKCTSSWKSKVKFLIKHIETQRNHVKVAVHQSLKYNAPPVSAHYICPWWTNGGRFH